MSGHSKWHSIKHKKAAQDAKKGKIFTKIIREISVAARLGGPDPDKNPRLRKAIAEAKAVNMPSDNIKRAIMKGTGQLEGSSFEEVNYEGYGPGGVAIMVKCLTDNRNRSAADIRSIFNKRGGNMGESGCVSYMFDQKGVLVIDREDDDTDDETMMMHALEAGAEDIIVNADSYEVLTHPHEFEEVKTALDKEGFVFSSAEVRWLPQNTVNVEGEHAEKLVKMMDAFEENDDVQDVYANYEMDDEEADGIS